MDLLEKEWFIEAPWGRICIVAWGNCLDTPVLVCHGENDSAASWRPLLRLLPKNFYYIGMELPGNGKSDHLPAGIAISLFDLVYAIEVVRRHYRWEQFVYLAHSVAGTIGRLYNLAYPGRMSKVIEVDTITPSLGIAPEQFSSWYNYYFKRFYNNYEKFNASKESAPTYTWEEVFEKLDKMRGLNEEKARATVERFSEPVGGGKIRFTVDQRMKILTRPAFSKPQLEKLFTSLRTPTLAIVASNSEKLGLYMNTPYMLREAAFDGTYRVRRVEGSHDVHITNPERVAPYVSQFLLYGLDGLDGKAKL